MTLLTGIWSDLWGLDFFDLDFLVILTAYLFMAFGQISAGVFALGQGFLIDVFSGGLHGLFTAAYLSVFFVLLLGSRFFNLLNLKGQIIIVSLSVLLPLLSSKKLIACNVQEEFLSKDGMSKNKMDMQLFPAQTIQTAKPTQNLLIHQDRQTLLISSTSSSNNKHAQMKCLE